MWPPYAWPRHRSADSHQVTLTAGAPNSPIVTWHARKGDEARRPSRDARPAAHARIAHLNAAIPTEKANADHPDSAREVCPDNEKTQSSRRSSRPSIFDGICQATHEYAPGQRPLFGMTGHRQPAPSFSSARDGDYGAEFGSARGRDWALNRWGSGHGPRQPAHSRQERRAVVIIGVVAVWRVATSRWVLRRWLCGRGGRR